MPTAGAIAGLYARTDASRGVWKAPAGTEATLRGPTGSCDVPLTRPRERHDQPARPQRIRAFPVYGNVVWGARTLRRRRPARRASGSTSRCAGIALYIEESLVPRHASGSCSSPTTSRCGRRSGSTSARSCTTCSGRARSRAARRGRPTSSSATARPRPRTTSTRASSTSSSASRRSSRPSSSSSRSQQLAGQVDDLRRARMAVQRQPAALRPVQELQVPGQVGQQVRRRRQQGGRAEADDRGRQAPRGRRPDHEPQVARQDRVRGDHARARRHPRPRVRAVGQQGLELRRRARARGVARATSARTSSSSSTTRPASS